MEADLLPTSNGAGSETLEFQHPDRLGTKLVTNNQANTSFEQSTLPFGTSLDAETSGTTNQRFTSYDRSTVAQLDYAVNRSYSSGQGRFTSPDPIGMGATNLGDPQSLNMYAYSGNEPINFTDPSGLNESMCSAEYSYGQCGGDGGFWGNSGYGAGGGGGGGFGDSVAYRNQTLGDLPPELQNSVDQHLQRISNSQAGKGFITNAEAQQNESREFKIFYGIREDGSNWTHFYINDVFSQGHSNLNDNARGLIRELGGRRGKATLNLVTAMGAISLAVMAAPLIADAVLAGPAIETGHALSLLSRGDLAAKFIGPVQTNLFKQVFTKGTIPSGLTREATMAYIEIARRSIAAGIDKGEQARRVKVLEEVVKKMKW